MYKQEFFNYKRTTNKTPAFYDTINEMEQKLGSGLIKRQLHSLLTQLYAPPDPQQGGRHVVQWESDVHDVIGCDATEPEEGHAHDGFEVTHPRRFGMTCKIKE